MKRAILISVLLVTFTSTTWADAPNSPASPSAAALSTSSIQLTWIDTNRVENAYLIERGMTTAGPFLQVASTPPNVTSFYDVGLAPSTTYYYRLRASVSAGRILTSTYSAVAAARTQTAATLFAPSISSVSPDPVIGSFDSLPFTILGSNFASGARVTLRDLSTGGAYQDQLPSLVTSDRLVINPTLTTAEHVWSAQVINLDGQSSEQFTFRVISPTPIPPATGLKAFPTAEGFGSGSVGGRGGDTYIVNSLADTGAGSLRACVESEGPRTCVFQTSGTIAVATPIVVRNPFLTIAGQTSVNGIALKIATGNNAGPFQINSHDVIIRHIRFRPGPSSMRSSNNDGLLVLSGVYNVMIDHCSFSWATDELINTVPASEGKPSPERITVQWSMAYEDLSKSTHINGEHSRGPYFESQKITMHHTLIASNQMRNPNLNLLGQFDMFNNVVYNAVEKFGEIYDLRGPALVNAIGNWTSMGPSSIKSKAIFGLDAYPEYRPNEGGGSGGAHGYQIYAQNNIGPRADGSGYLNPNDTPLAVAEPIGDLSMPADRLTSPRQAFLDVLAYAGAAPRDISDQRVAAYVRNCQGAKINDPSQVGGWPTLTWEMPVTDADRDGIADDWELAHGVTNKNGDRDGDGYTNLEEYLNELAGDNVDRVGTGIGSLPPMNCNYAVR